MSIRSPTPRRRRRPAKIRNLRRLIAPMDVVYQVGNVIYRRSLRYTLFTAGVGMLGLVSSSLSLPGFTVKQAIVLPLVIGGTSLCMGYLLRLIPSLIAHRLQTLAQASDLNLMEDCRKADEEAHLQALWDRVFRHECAIRLEAGDPPFTGLLPTPAAHDDATLLDAYLERARDAMGSAEPQLRQLHRVGLDLRYLEDWYDGAWFDRSDNKLVEQFEGSATLLAARRQACFCGPWVALRLKPRALAQRFWFWFTTRAVALQIAAAVESLNRRYETDLFNAQVLLWPGEEDEPWLEALDGAREAILERRFGALLAVFGPDLGTAREMLDHTMRGPFENATELRLRYDPEYCEGAAGCDVAADLRAERLHADDLRPYLRLAEASVAALAELDGLLATHAPELSAPARARERRAVRVAWHTDRDHIRRQVQREGPGGLGAFVAAVARDLDAYERRLVAVRVHHEITRRARAGYEALLRALVYDPLLEDASPDGKGT